MKRFVWMLVAAVLLSGCAAQETIETVADLVAVPAVAVPKTVLLELPEEAAAAAMQNTDTGTVYLCEDYTVTVEYLPSGDLDKTLRTLTGFGRDALTVMETGTAIPRYDCAWCSQAEEGDMIGRTAVLDDGEYHYAVSVLAKAELGGELEDAWNTLFESITLG